MTIPTTLFTNLVSETMLPKSELFFSNGLSRNHLDDSISLGETSVAMVIRDILVAGKSNEFFSTLASHQRKGSGFLERLTSTFRWNKLERKFVKAYKNILTEQIQMNDRSAAFIAENTMPNVMKLLSLHFSKANTDVNTLTKLIDSALPALPSINNTSNKG